MNDKKIEIKTLQNIYIKLTTVVTVSLVNICKFTIDLTAFLKFLSDFIERSVSGSEFQGFEAVKAMDHINFWGGRGVPGFLLYNWHAFKARI